MATKFFTNETGNTLLEKIEGVFNHRNVHFFDAPVESLGSGIPRILRAYGEDSFKFTDNFIRIIFPITVQDGTQLAPSWHLILKISTN